MITEANVGRSVCVLALTFPLPVDTTGIGYFCSCRTWAITRLSLSLTAKMMFFLELQNLFQFVDSSSFSRNNLSSTTSCFSGLVGFRGPWNTKTSSLLPDIWPGPAKDASWLSFSVVGEVPTLFPAFLFGFDMRSSVPTHRDRWARRCS